jgi:hypothetical protein
MLVFYCLLDYLSEKLKIICRVMGIKKDSKIRPIFAVLLLPIVIPIIIAVSIVCLVLFVLIICWNAIVLIIYSFFGIRAWIEVDGIRLSTYLKTIDRLLLWQDISEVSESFEPPFIFSKVLLKSGELIKIDLSGRDLEIALAKHEIPFTKNHQIDRRNDPQDEDL